MSYCFELQTFTDYRGNLTVVEEGFDVQFPIKRVFWLHGVHDFRGGHAHYKNKMILVCVTGSTMVNVKSSGSELKYELNRPDLALYLEPEDWRKLDMTEHSVVLALCSEPFDENDYIA